MEQMIKLTMVDFLSAPLLEDYFDEEGITYLKESFMGAALAMSLGDLQDSYTFYVSSKDYDKAKAFLDELYEEGLLKG